MSTTRPSRSLRRALRPIGRACAVVAGVAAVLAAAVGVAGLIAGEPPGNGSWDVGPVLGASLTAVALWPVGRRYADRVTGRLTRDARRDPAEVVRAFGRRSARDLPDDELLVQLAEALVRVHHASSAEVWRDDGTGVLRPVVSVPDRRRVDVVVGNDARSILAGGGIIGRAWLEMWLPAMLDDRPLGEVRVAPATHAGELLGLVVVRRPAGGDRFTADEDASLAELGVRLGVVLHNRELDAALRESVEDLRRTNAELRASRVRLVSAADAERRRIERDLHDGAQQHLVALAVDLRLGASEVAADPSRSPAVFAALGADVHAAIDELRALAHGIYPPLLLDAGLPEALEASGRRSASPVTVSAHGIGRYGPEVEAAVYFCCMEALQNAAKHAPGAAVRVRLEHAGDTLHLVVEDDGPGIDGDVAGRGHGIQNMVDRLGALGGDLVLERAPGGGARVHGTVPVGPVPEVA